MTLDLLEESRIVGQKKMSKDEWKRIPATPEALAKAVLTVDAEAVKEHIKREEAAAKPRVPKG